MTELIASSYQLVHLMKLRTNGFRSLLISDGVGVGKTISSGYIVFHQSIISRRPVVIVCPPILVDKWVYEMKSKFGLLVKRASNKDTFELMIDELQSGVEWEKGPVYVTSYSVLSLSESSLHSKIGLIVMDEIHNARNRKTKLHPKLLQICSNSEYRVGLSATPINNSTADLAAILNLLIPTINYEKIEALLSDFWGLPICNSISCITTRFTKEEISSHFCERNIVPVEIEFSDSYARGVSEKMAELFPESRASQLESTSMHRIAASSPAAFRKSTGLILSKDLEDPKLLKILEILHNYPKERFLIFTEFKETAKYLADNIPNRLVLLTTGDVNTELREANSFLFKDTKSSVMIMTPVGSEGLDFQFCSMLINYDLHWNPMKIEQRIGRIDRIGQKKSTISIFNFHVIGSIDERVREVMGNKLNLVSGTFADVSRIVNGSDRLTQSPNSNFVISKEREAANELVRSTEFYNQTHFEDSLVLDNISKTNCEFRRWNLLDWSGNFPWSNLTQNWEEALVSQRKKFSDLLRMYGGEVVIE